MSLAARIDGLVAAQRDPHARARLSALVIALVVLWPLALLAEFRPWLLFDSANLKVMGNFLAGFLPERAEQRRQRGRELCIDEEFHEPRSTA